ncbi:uncharacterized protein LACBIDRAFT_301681 [Laccaria bicolor S238N-H82]|uniref:Predicted protein n=1 Tax=Laccaria bicolor (strain S238N-H82 / ATCC MYA-4686) TaxID=486041 RepID=B0CP18_LACBS|nr:uncharacterized protein LACBIDRAFT_301681 [Laccaria bicolor S238N-H82]EDR16032.1 predicted protein [Laccaria bicolor S238N-H82]|eukprot:XP_001874240.1 predicted protein [Laccaria bicolor S238N-H82]
MRGGVGSRIWRRGTKANSNRARECMLRVRVSLSRKELLSSGRIPSSLSPKHKPTTLLFNQTTITSSHTVHNVETQP